MMQLRNLAAACAALVATGCAALVPGAERIQVQQGNLLSSQDIARLEEGLTRSQVSERVGVPILASPWRTDRWDYVYYRTEAGRRPQTRQRLTLYFDERDRVERIVNQYEPPEDVPKATQVEKVPTVDTGATGATAPTRDGDPRRPGEPN